jgi:ankyrin repeat protein
MNATNLNAWESARGFPQAGFAAGGEIMRRLKTVLLAAGIAVAGVSTVFAQTPPSASETAAYRGLHAAAAAGDVAEIRRLAAAGGKLEETDSAGRTPLHVAAFNSRYDAVRALIAAGANARAQEHQRYDIVTIAAVKDDEKMVTLALEQGGSAKDITSPYDGTALIAAAHLGHDGVVRELIRFGAPLDHVNNLGWTALIEAVILGDGGPRHVACAKALVDAGANPKLADRSGVNPLQHARRRGYAAMVALLEKAEQPR